MRQDLTERTRTTEGRIPIAWQALRPVWGYTTRMATDNVSRRALLKAAGSTGIIGGLPQTVLAFQTPGAVTHEVAAGPAQQQTPKHTIKFAVIGLDHSHINGITDTIRRSGGELV